MPQVRVRHPSPRQRGIARKRSVAPKKLTRAFLRIEWLKLGGLPVPDLSAEYDRPRTYADCIDQGLGLDGAPCPWVSCHRHLYLDVNPETGSITFNFPDMEPWELKHTCANRLSERGGMTLEEVGDAINITRERVRQIEVRTMIKKMKPDVVARGIEPGDIGAFAHSSVMGELIDEGTPVEQVPSTFAAY